MIGRQQHATRTVSLPRQGTARGWRESSGSTASNNATATKSRNFCSGSLCRALLVAVPLLWLVGILSMLAAVVHRVRGRRHERRQSAWRGFESPIMSRLFSKACPTALSTIAGLRAARPLRYRRAQQRCVALLRANTRRHDVLPPLKFTAGAAVQSVARVYVVTCWSFAKRRAAAIRQLRRLGIEATMVDVFSASTAPRLSNTSWPREQNALLEECFYSQPNEAEEKRTENPLGTSERFNFLSHSLVYANVVEDNTPYALVFEDDAETTACVPTLTHCCPDARLLFRHSAMCKTHGFAHLLCPVAAQLISQTDDVAGRRRQQLHHGASTSNCRGRRI